MGEDRERERERAPGSCARLLCDASLLVGECDRRDPHGRGMGRAHRDRAHETRLLRGDGILVIVFLKCDRHAAGEGRLPKVRVGMPCHHPAGHEPIIREEVQEGTGGQCHGFIQAELPRAFAPEPLHQIQHVYGSDGSGLWVPRACVSCRCAGSALRPFAILGRWHRAVSRRT